MIDLRIRIRASGPEADVAVSGNVDRAGRRAGTNAQRQTRAAGHVADEPVRLVRADVPGLRGEAAAAGLLLANGRRVGGGDVDVEARAAVAQTELAGAGDEQ